MQEHIRTHPRVEQHTPPGRRETLSLGTLFIPEKLARKKALPLLVFFHGGSWLPEDAAARNRMAAIAIQIGAGSGVYVRAFQNNNRLADLIQEAESKSGTRFSSLTIGGWSAGCGALREIFRAPAYQRVNRILCIDGIHSGYDNGRVEAAPVETWLQAARDALAGAKPVLITHSEIFPGTYASTTETADYLIERLRLKQKAVLKWGPMGTQQLGEVRQGRLRILAYAGNSAPDHVDQLHSLAKYLKWLR